MAQVLPSDALAGSEAVMRCGCTFRGWHGQVLFVEPCAEDNERWEGIPRSRRGAPEWGHPAMVMWPSGTAPTGSQSQPGSEGPK